MNQTHPQKTRAVQADPIALMALSCVAYILAIFMHEAGGHALSCVLLGAHLKSIGAFYVDCDATQVSVAAQRTIAASGVLVNVLVGWISHMMLKKARGPQGRFFLWLVMAISLLDAAGYLMFSGVSGLGDFGDGPSGFFAGESHFLLHQVVLTVAGVGLYFVVVLLLVRALQHVVSPEATPGQVGRLLSLSYLSGGLLALLIGLMNPYGWVLVLTSAAASTLGGTSGLLWLGYLHSSGTGIAPNLNVRRNGLMLASCVLLVGFYAVLFGTGMQF